MPEHSVRLTREALYDLVWSKPMTTIAAEFGMSSVAFAKYCKEADVPRPGRGYWRQLACGHMPVRDKLPKAKAGTPVAIVIGKYQRPTMGRRSPRGGLPVEVPEHVHKFHPVARELDGLLHGGDWRYKTMLAVRGDGRFGLQIGESSRRRVLRLLHTLFTSLEQHGYAVRLTQRADESHRGHIRQSLQIIVDDQAVQISLREHLNRKEHEKTEAEKRYTWLARKYDLEPSGDLILELHIPWGTDTRTRWRDGGKGRLEDFLGEVVWAVSEASRGLALHRARLAEQARQAEVARKVAAEREHERRLKAEKERRRREREEREAAHQKGLADDLVKMATAWRQADTIRAFLGTVTEKLAEADRSEAFAAWFAWAMEHAEKMDPLTEPKKIAKALGLAAEDVMRTTGSSAP